MSPTHLGCHDHFLQSLAAFDNLHFDLGIKVIRVEVTQYLILLKRKQSEFSESLPQIPGKIIIHGIFLECFKKFISVVKTLQSLFQLS